VLRTFGRNYLVAQNHQSQIYYDAAKSLALFVRKPATLRDPFQTVSRLISRLVSLYPLPLYRSPFHSPFHPDRRKTMTDLEITK
jgi:hypothetical protein